MTLQSFLTRPMQTVAFAILATAAHGALASCCGVGAMPTDSPDGGSYVDTNGTVKFASIRAGGSEQFLIPVKDSAQTDETISSARITGPDADAFQILSTFPIAVPNGESASVNVRFAPTASGTFTATLEIQTVKMGVSPVELSGYGNP